MKKILIINASPRSGQTQKSIDIFIEKLGGVFDIEILNLRDISLPLCGGCAVCLSKGEEYCPAKSARDIVLKKMDAAGAIVFATPNYVVNVPALLKNLIDHLAFAFHRPRFFNKVFTSIITQGSYGGKEVDKYLNTVAGFSGGVYVHGVVLTLPTGAYNPTLPWKADEQKAVDKKLEGLAGRFIDKMNSKKPFSPSLFRVIMFRFTRSAHKYARLDNKDYHYFQSKGWFDSGYYYDVKLDPLQSIVGSLSDMLAKIIVNK